MLLTVEDKFDTAVIVKSSTETSIILTGYRQVKEFHCKIKYYFENFASS